VEAVSATSDTDLYRGLLLFPQHAALLRGSGITAEVAQARGYVSVDTKAALGRFGFGQSARRVPGLLIPVWDVTGRIAFHQYRPDTPRTNADGKPVKYETPRNARMALDVHPFAKEWIGDPGRPLFVTEGIRKADAAVSRWLCCITLLGVWNWRGRNELGGKVALSDWELVALDGRQVYIVFDSDVMVKPEVHSALARLRAFLEMRGAKVALVYLPPGEGGVKVGLDDYLAAGHTVADLLALATPELRAPATAMAPSIPIGEQPNTRTPPDLDALKARAAPILAAADPLEVFGAAVRTAGYGGDPGPALLTYLVAASRVLGVRRGEMLPHLLLVGPPGAGKNYLIQTILQFLPAAAYHSIDAGSPRALIYDRADLRHRALIFGEADSLPAGEDNPAASAIRNLLQDHHLHYQVTVRNPKTGDFVVRHVEKPGPTVLITTATRRLGDQLDSRLFVLNVPDTQEQIRAALCTQAALETEDASPPPDALVAYQSYLQALAPWSVTVPFAAELAEATGRTPVPPRILRDFARLLSLIKASTVLRHQHRRRDAQQRLVAEVADYATVYGLVRDVYAASVTGAGRGVREVVSAVEALVQGEKRPITVTAVAARMGLAKSSAGARVRAGLRGGWLSNVEPRRGHPFDLALGEPLPPESGLPCPSTLGCSGVRALTGEKEPATTWTA
jgi:hypothetical protein